MRSEEGSLRASGLMTLGDEWGDILVEGALEVKQLDGEGLHLVGDLAAAGEDMEDLGLEARGEGVQRINK